MKRGRKIWCQECRVWVWIGDDYDKNWSEHESQTHGEYALLSEHPDLAALDAEMDAWYE